MLQRRKEVFTGNKTTPNEQEATKDSGRHVSVQKQDEVFGNPRRLPNILQEVPSVILHCITLYNMLIDLRKRHV